MGFLDKLLGREPLQQQRPQQTPQPPDRAALCRPAAARRRLHRGRAGHRPLQVPAAHRAAEDIEKVHAEAFAKLSPEQRQMVLQRLDEDLPEGERPRSDQPADLARSATRAEMSRPGYLQGAFGGGRGGMGGMGMGGMIAGSMLGTIAGVVVGLGPRRHDARRLRLLARGPGGRRRATPTPATPATPATGTTGATAVATARWRRRRRRRRLRLRRLRRRLRLRWWRLRRLRWW